MDILKTSAYDEWFKKLRDVATKAKINARIRRIEINGELIGDFKSVGEKVIELRFDTGPGYRIYVTLEDKTMLLLLVGGDKSTQSADIEKAKALATEWRSSDGR